MAEQFDKIVSRHGEHGVQAILENWERHEGIAANHLMSLEDRWDHFLTATNNNTARAAA